MRDMVDLVTQLINICLSATRRWGTAKSKVRCGAPLLYQSLFIL